MPDTKPYGCSNSNTIIPIASNRNDASNDVIVLSLRGFKRIEGVTGMAKQLLIKSLDGTYVSGFVLQNHGSKHRRV